MLKYASWFVDESCIDDMSISRRPGNFTNMPTRPVFGFPRRDEETIERRVIVPMEGIDIAERSQHACCFCKNVELIARTGHCCIVPVDSEERILQIV